MHDVKTVNDAFAMVSGRGGKVAWKWLWDTDGAWKPISSVELYGRVRALAAALAGWGVGKGDRVALLAENRWEWPVTDFAVLALGAVDVPLYPTLTAEQVGYMLRDSGAKVAVVSSKEQYERVSAAGDLPDLEHVVVMDSGTFGGADSFGDLMANAAGMQVRDAGFDAQAKAVGPDDLATIIYTSGTTGEPKGVMLTHGNLASNFSITTGPYGFGEKDSCISLLPLSHATARHLDYGLDVRWSDDCLLPEVRPAGGGDEGGEADDFCGGASGLREDSAGRGGQVGWVEEDDSELGVGGRQGASGGDAGGQEGGRVGG